MKAIVRMEVQPQREIHGLIFQAIKLIYSDGTTGIAQYFPTLDHFDLDPVEYNCFKPNSTLENIAYSIYQPTNPTPFDEDDLK